MTDLLGIFVILFLATWFYLVVTYSKKPTKRSDEVILFSLVLFIFLGLIFAFFYIWVSGSDLVQVVKDGI